MGFNLVSQKHFSRYFGIIDLWVLTGPEGPAGRPRKKIEGEASHLLQRGSQALGAGQVSNIGHFRVRGELILVYEIVDMFVWVCSLLSHAS